MDSGEDMDFLFVMPLYCQLLTVLLELHLPSLHLPVSECWHPLPVRPDCAVGEQMLEECGTALTIVHIHSVSFGEMMVITMDPDTPSPS